MLVLGLAGARTTVAAATVAMNSGFYDHQIIQYEATAEVTSSPQAAQLIAHGNIVFLLVGSEGVTQNVQCARLLAALANDAMNRNVLNFIPTEFVYTGARWYLPLLH